MCSYSNVISFQYLSIRNDVSDRVLAVVPLLVIVAIIDITGEDTGRGVRVRMEGAAGVQSGITATRIVDMTLGDVIDPAAAAMSANEGAIDRGARVHAIIVGETARDGNMNTVGEIVTKGEDTVIENHLHHTIMGKIGVVSQKDLAWKASDYRAARLLRRDTTTWVPIGSCWIESDRSEIRSDVVSVKVHPPVDV